MREDSAINGYDRAYCRSSDGRAYEAHASALATSHSSSPRTPVSLCPQCSKAEKKRFESGFVERVVVAVVAASACDSGVCVTKDNVTGPTGEIFFLQWRLSPLHSRAPALALSLAFRVRGSMIVARLTVRLLCRRGFHGTVVASKRACRPSVFGWLTAGTTTSSSDWH